jgi:hypothetical protein
LYWAIRGAGAESFGIISKFIFRIYKAPKQVIYAQNSYSIEKFPEVFIAYQYLVDGVLPRAVYATLEVLNRTVEILFTDPDGNPTRIQKYMSRFPKHPIKSTFLTLSYPDFLFKVSAEQSHQNLGGGQLKKPSDLANVTRRSSTPVYKKEKGYFMNRKLSLVEILKFYSLVLEIPEDGYIFHETFGGRISDVPPGRTAFVHRYALYHLQIRYQTENLDPDQILQGTAWVNHVFEKTKVFLQHNESYQNTVDGDLKDYLERYYGSNLKRLIQIKHRYDPKNFFQGPQTIPTKKNYICKP